MGRSAVPPEWRAPVGSERAPLTFTERPFSLDGLAIPPLILEMADGAEPELAWRNALDGLTFRLGDRYLKWNPRSTGIDQSREPRVLEWLAGRHPVPRLLASGDDGTAQWMLTAALPGESAVLPGWIARPEESVRAIATGLRALHALPVEEVPAALRSGSWPTRTPARLGPRPAVIDPVVVHGDACSPNTLIDDAGRWAGHVDVGDLTVGDRWADLAVATMSIGWNYGEGHDAEFYATYGIEPDEERVRWYRALWDAES